MYLIFRVSEHFKWIIQLFNEQRDSNLWHPTDYSLNCWGHIYGYVYKSCEVPWMIKRLWIVVDIAMELDFIGCAFPTRIFCSGVSGLLIGCPSSVWRCPGGTVHGPLDHFCWSNFWQIRSGVTPRLSGLAEWLGLTGWIGYEAKHHFEI